MMTANTGWSGIVDLAGDRCFVEASWDSAMAFVFPAAA